MRGEVRSSDGTTVRWLAAGRGQPLVLVPGGLGDEHAFDPLITHLRDRLRCLTIGRRGKGFSDDAQIYSYEREYEDIVSVLGTVGPPRFLFAHSSGAICALGAALRSGVEKLTLVEPPLPLDGPSIDPEHHAALQAALQRGDAETAVLIGLRHALKLEPRTIEAWRARADWPTVLRRGVAWLRELDEINRLPGDLDRYRAIQAPTLLIYGTATQPRRRRVVEALANTIPNSEIAAFDGYGHDVANAAAVEVAATIIAFLEA